MFGAQKTPFGGTTGFGTTTKPFGAAKTAGTGAFGTSSFGATQTPATGGLFGGTTANTGTGLFGGTSFGTPSTSTSTFGGFGTSTTQTGGGLFGTSTSTAGTGLFATPQQQTAPFGAANKTGFGGFGTQTSTAATGTGLFGATQQTPSLFGGGQTTSTGLFGGVGSIGAGTNGTTVKFNPVSGSDTMMKNGVSQNIRTAHQCITAMKEYETKSLEELRVEDYLANRKGGSTGTTGLFGATATPQTGGGLFGTATTTSATGFTFGKPAFGTGQTQTKGATGFGTPSTGTGLFGQTQTTQAGGLFASPFGGTATTTTPSTGFSFGQPSTGTGLFGQTQQKTGLFGQPTTQTTGLFGTPSTTTTTGFGTTFGTGTFGTQNQAGGLFGTNKAPTFGATTTTSTTGGLFGNTATNTGGLFGQNKPGLTLGLGTGGFGTGAFGTTTTSTGTSLFGQKPANTFGAGLGTGLGAGLGTLGTASIFGNTGLGAGLNTGTTGLNLTQPSTALGTDAAAQLAQQAQIQQQLQALANSPFGDSPLFRNNVADPAKRAELLKPTSLAAQKALTTPSHYKISPRPTAKIKPKPLHSLAAGKSQLFEGLDDDDTSLSNDTFVPRRSVKKLIIKNKASPTASEIDAGEEDDLLAPPAYPSDTFLVEDKRTSESEKENDPMENLYSNPVRKPIPETPANKSSPAPDDSIIALNLRQRSRSPGEDSMGAPVSDDQAEEEVEREPHPAGIVLTKNEYYTEPSLDELANMVDENGDCWVENFVIGREGYGSVFFPGLTNVANLNLDETVHIRRKEITVYPDDSTKPPEGDGLNKKAEVTLHCTWPMDKTAHVPIKSPERLKKMGYQEKIEVATSKIGARFLEYRPGTGSWVFQVPHFSKYGLDDSEDEEELVGQDQKKMKMQQQADLQKQQQQKENQPPSLNSQPPITERVKAEQPIMEQMQDDSDMADISQEPIPELAPNSSGDQDGLEGLSEEEVVPSSHRLATHLGMSAHRMQVMKASFFGDEEEEAMDYKPVFGGVSGKSSLRGSAPPSGSASPLPHRMVESKMDRGSFLAHTARLGSLGSPVRGLGGMSPSHSPRTRIPSGGFSPKFSPKVEQSVSGLFPSVSRPAPYPMFERNQGLLLPSGLTSEMERPRKIVGSQRQPMLLPWKETVTSEKQSLVADAALMMGRSFKVGWGQNWTLVRCAGPDKEAQAPERKKETGIPFSILPKSTPRLAKLGTASPFSVIMERVDVAPHFVVQDKVTVANHVSHLEVELETSLCSTEDHPCPVFVPTPGVRALHQHAEVAARNRENTGVRHPERESADHASLVLSLCVALWGDLPDQDREDEDNGLDRTSYAYHMARREAVSHWLMNQAEETIQQEVQDSKFKEGGHTDAIFSLLSGRQISQACSLAQQSGDHRLALLLAQAGGSHFPREVVGKQLSDWEELKADRFISDSRLRVYALLAGKPVWPATNGEINTCENLDWKRALAVHLWYLCTPSATVPEALHLYLKAFTKSSEYGEYANPPLPPYLERSADRPGDLLQEDRYVIRDMCYHLLQLYADRSHQLERLLAPTTSTPNQLDFRLSWLVCQMLQALDYTHLSEHHLNTLHAGYIAQLESLGLWEWAVFVALHIADNARRELVTKELLCRHCSLSEEEAYVQKEQFLQEKLRVPAVWIHEAKALRAHYEGKSHDEAWHLLKAGKWNASHRIVLKHLAADAIINEDYEYLEEFLEDLSPPERSSTIQDWNFGGRVFLDYIHVNNALVEMAKGSSSSYDLERLHPQVTSLCSRIENIPCLTPKDRLCQSEMAKKAASFLRLVLEGQNKPPTLDGECVVPSYQLAPHITKLPMPEDYALQELRALTHSYMVELTT